MKFSIFSLLVLASTASAATIPYLARSTDYKPSYPRGTKPFYPRQAAASLNSTISTLNSNSQALATAIKNFQGGLGGIADAATKQRAVTSSLTAATSAVKAMSPLSPADSKSLLATAQTMPPYVKMNLDALTGRKSEVESAGFTSQVTSGITSLKTQTDDLTNAMAGIATADVKPMLMAVTKTNDDAFEAALKSFGGAAA